jgi:lipoate-protein ligase B
MQYISRIEEVSVTATKEFALEETSYSEFLSGICVSDVVCAVSLKMNKIMFLTSMHVSKTLL